MKPARAEVGSEEICTADNADTSAELMLPNWAPPIPASAVLLSAANCEEVSAAMSSVDKALTWAEFNPPNA